MPHLAETTNDAMFVALTARYPSAGKTLGDLLAAYWAEFGLANNGATGFQYFVSQSAAGSTRGDAGNSFWNSQADTLFYDHQPAYVFSYFFENGDTLVWENAALSKLGV